MNALIGEVKWQDAVGNAKHYLAVGQEEIYLYGPQEGPWEYVKEVDSGGGHRLEMCTSVSFTAHHPCGLRFRWTFDLEERDANGKGYFQIRTFAIERVYGLLPPEAAKQLKHILLAGADAIEKNALEYRDIWKREMVTVCRLRSLGQ